MEEQTSVDSWYQGLRSKTTKQNQGLINELGQWRFRNKRHYLSSLLSNMTSQCDTARGLHLLIYDACAYPSNAFTGKLHSATCQYAVKGTTASSAARCLIALPWTHSQLWKGASIFSSHILEFHFPLILNSYPSHQWLLNLKFQISSSHNK